MSRTLLGHVRDAAGKAGCFANYSEGEMVVRRMILVEKANGRRSNAYLTDVIALPEPALRRLKHEGRIEELHRIVIGTCALLPTT